MATAQHQQQSTVPTSTFSFTAPLTGPPAPSSALKHRRVSLALPSAPREVPVYRFRDDTSLPDAAAAPRGKVRRVATDSGAAAADATATEKKARRKWTMDETQMLVDGCNKHGVGNWKAILSDPTFSFEGRSPVDLKDRFRTYFPDAYKQHYPNAKTHLSSKVRASLPDGSSLFEKTRSKKRRPFTAEEDAALKAGYDRYGTVWATIVKDPVFQDQNRRSTDLRDRFRNAFPDLYQAAGYKPRSLTSKKKRTGSAAGGVSGGAGVGVIGDQAPSSVLRALTDEQIPQESGPSRRKRRHTTQGFLRGGTKSVPLSPTGSDDESSPDEDEDEPPSSSLAHKVAPLAPPGSLQPQPPPPPTVAMPHVSPAATRTSSTTSTSASASTSLATPCDTDTDADMIFADMDDVQPIDFSEFGAGGPDASHAWSTPPIDTPVHSSAAWSASPTSSHDILFSDSPFAGPPYNIGKSAWGPHDWLAGHPRMDPASGLPDGLGGSGGASPMPFLPFAPSGLSSPYGVMDRYDLFPGAPSSAFDSGADSVSVSASAFSDPDGTGMGGMGGLGLGLHGFTHHSRTAGDLIFGARTHQPQPDYGPGFGFGLDMGGVGGVGLMHHHHHHPPQGPLPGIDEIELSAITLNEPADADVEFGDAPPPNPPLTPPPVHDDARHSTATTSSAAAAVASRSLSVPPPEHRVFQHSTASTQQGYTAFTPTRSLSLDVIPPQAPGSSSLHHPHPHTQPQPPVDLQALLLGLDTTAFRGAPGSSSGGAGDVPFLDLHYYPAAGAGAAEAAAAHLEGARQGLALDLAGRDFFAAAGRGGSAFDFAAATAAAAATGGRGALTADGRGFASLGVEAEKIVRGRNLHARGASQGVVRPADLIAPGAGVGLGASGGDRKENKRKRASWDGAR